MTKPARRKTSKVVTMPTVEWNSQAANRSADVTDRYVARRAFELYCERGCRDGHDLDDWLQAERELRDGVRFHVA
jgi:hypothetical protein